MALFVGIDGGGTKTAVSFLDTDNKSFLTRQGGPSNPATVGWDQAQELVVGLVADGVHAMNRSLADVVGISVCMAGIDRPDQVLRLERTFVTSFANAAIEVTNDALAALSAGTGGSPGIVLIAGTGSIAVGERADGATARAGGYGNLIGDEGSGFDIGRQGIMAAIQCAENRGPNTVLWSRLQTFFNIELPGEIIDHIYGADHPVSTIASFARIVMDAAEADKVASSIVSSAVMQYRALIQSVDTQLEGRVGPKVVLAGGLLTHYDWLVERLTHELADKQFHPLRIPASSGALLRARQCWLRHQNDAVMGDSSSVPDDEQQFLSLWKRLNTQP